MIDANLHKLCGFFAGLVATWLTRRYNVVVDPVFLTGIFVGISMLVGTLVSKWTNPTGANTKDAAKALEAVVVQERVRAAAARPAIPHYDSKKAIDHDRE